MLRPTAEELQEAASLDIDCTGLNGPQVRYEIRRAKARLAPEAVFRREVTSKEELQYTELCSVAVELGIEVTAGITLPDLQSVVEARLGEIFEAKRFTEGATIQYTYNTSWQSSRRARILHISITWKQGMPYIHLHMEDKARPQLYYAHQAALYADLVE